MQDRLIEIARKELAHKQAHAARERGYTFHHGLRTGRLALKLAAEHSKDTQQPSIVLFAAGLFHDCAKGTEPHHTLGAERAAELLAGVLPTVQAAAACEIIADHRRRENPSRCPLATQLVQDADILDHLGAQNVWLAIHWNAHHAEPADMLHRFYYGKENQDYLDQCLAALNLDVSRREFATRREVEERFFSRYKEELGGDWPA